MELGKPNIFSLRLTASQREAYEAILCIEQWVNEMYWKRMPSCNEKDK